MDSDPEDGYLTGLPWVLGWGGAAAGWRPLAGSGPVAKEAARKCEMAIARQNGTVYLACSHGGTKLTVRAWACGLQQMPSECRPPPGPKRAGKVLQTGMLWAQPFARNLLGTQPCAKQLDRRSAS